MYKSCLTNKENLMTKKQIDKALFEGCREGDFNKVRLALNFGADMGAKNKYGQTPLDLAVFWNRIKIVELLIDRGADLEAKTNDGSTRLHWVSRWNRIETAKLLLERGADVRAKDEDGRTPLYWAVCNNHTKLAELLKKYMK